MSFEKNAAMAALEIMVAAQAAYGGEDGIFGRYSRKAGGDLVKFSIHPIGAGDGTSPRAQVFFIFESSQEVRLTFDGVGHLKRNRVTLYSNTHRLIVTLNKGTVDLSLEQSCGDHRLYPGYGYYTDHCDPEVARLEPFSKGLRKESS